MSPSRSAAFRPFRAPLTLAIGLILSAHAVAGTTAEADAKRDPTKNVDAVIVVGQRYLPDYQVRHTRSATKTDTPLINVCLLYTSRCV